MSRISSCVNQMDSHWVKVNQQLIQKHPAWHEDINAQQAEALLRGKAPFTYLLHKGDKEYAYFISFVKGDHTVYHQPFTLEHDLKGWYYKNATPTRPTEIIEELIPQMMHCNSNECLILARS
ncbi:MAG: hypothetical protein HYZ47_03010 [Simkania negevensis]|nr:hypothetical protein [Simkania negevensis]